VRTARPEFEPPGRQQRQRSYARRARRARSLQDPNQVPAIAAPANHRGAAAAATGKFGTAAEVANGVVFLASPAASRISGTNLVIDGALTVAV